MPIFLLVLFLGVVAYAQLPMPCVPPDGQFEGSATVRAAGDDTENMIVNNFHGTFRNGDRFVGTVTLPDCLPVASDFYSNQTGFVRRTFFDLTLGIADPTVFLPPKECP